MFCKNCGKVIDDNAVICPNCGVQVRQVQTGTPSYTQSNGNTIAIVGFVFSFLIALVGLICSVVGYKNAVKQGAPHKGLALAGIIISIVSMVLAFILYMIMFATVMAVA